MIVQLTAFQLDEVEGLLDVRADTIESGEDLILWGTVDRAAGTLTVLDAAEAVEELHWRADFMIDEGPGHTGHEITGQAGARSLRLLADKIEVAAASA